MKTRALIIFSFFLLPAIAWAGGDRSPASIRIQKAKREIKIDGRLDELAWQDATLVNEFWQHYPVDTMRAIARTEVRVLYDDEFIYVGAVAYEPNSQPVVLSLKDDDMQNFWTSDGFSLSFDPINQDKSGYFFGMNAAGAKVDGTLSQSGVRPVLDTFWDNVWYADASNDSEGYYYEFAIPFSSMKYDTDIQDWGVNFIRNDMARGAWDVWTRFSSNYDGLDFGFNGNMSLDDQVPMPSGGKLVMVPSISGNMVKDQEEGNVPEYGMTAGLEAKLAIGSSMNLDASIYPDFSTVEVDQQYINFFQFEYYMPEMRSFFLENKDLFTDFGTYVDAHTPGDASRIKPLYTRRIGIVDWEYVPMPFGVRFSGNATESLRVGLLNVQNEKHDGELAQNFSVASFQQSVMGRSTVKGLFTNKQSTEGFGFESDEYNRSAGLEFDYMSKNTKWWGSAKYHRSFNTESQEDANFYGGGLAYNSRKFQMQNWVYYVGENYVNEMGFIPRLYHEDTKNDTTIRRAFTEVTTTGNWATYPSGGLLRYFGPSYYLYSKIGNNGSLDEMVARLSLYGEFNDGAGFGLNYTYTENKLIVGHDVLDNDNPVPEGLYKNSKVSGFLNTNNRKTISFNLMGEYGQYYSGTKLFTTLGMTYRIQPWGTFRLNYSIGDVKFPDELGEETYHLVGLRSEVSFNKDMSWTTLVQYNTQAENMNINSMFQWRYRPLSDFMLVLKEDMESGSLDHKRFQLVFKLNYRFSI